jgi:formylglycine-generating enzyme required for sulfatase activity
MGDGSASTSCVLADLLPVGSKPSGAGKYNQLDLAGSVSEWTLDWFEGYPAYCDNCANVNFASDSGRVARGGSWDNTASGLLSASRYARIPAQDSGIRCARAAQ